MKLPPQKPNKNCLPFSWCVDKMTDSSIPVEQDELSCPVCLDLFNNPVTVPCGHSFCMNCIRRCWDREDGTGIYHCPQCQQTFQSRPVLGKNIVLANLVEEKNQCGPGPGPGPGLGPGTGLGLGPGTEFGLGLEPVWCDVCPKGMQLAVKSCLQCLASYCKAHLGPHNESSALKKHQLTESTTHLQDLVCAVHREPLKVYCRTDQRCFCLLCTMDQHKHHDTVSAVAECAERQKSAQTNFQKWIQEREKKLLDTRQAEHLLTHAARTAVEESERLFADIIHSIEGQRSRVKELILCEERKALVPVKSLQERLEQEITQLRGRDAELQKLAQMEDPISFLQRWRFLSTDPGPCIVPGVTAVPNHSFEFVSKAVSELKDQMETVCQDKFDKLLEKVSRVNKVSAPPSRKHRTRAESPSTSTSRTELRKLRSGETGNGCGPRATKVQILESPESLPEPRTREEFLKYACELTLDPNTAHAQLLLSDRDREVRRVKEKQRYPNSPEGFDFNCQVLCRQALSGRRCYWEAEVKGNKAEIAVAYKGIKRKDGDRSNSFGRNDKSWSLCCINGVYSIFHNKNAIRLPVPYCSKVGVYLDHPAGTLSFYSVSDIMSLIHRVETKFTEPVYAGFWIGEQCSVKLMALVHHPNIARRTTL
ncbi:tripartite motif-containing protein 16-like [Anguilla rostrata]|uniref:tripartite motif-containing protein 16-like n=1 Tax=Anguilla rostrata TaxID=7938 RepID=UPI0030CD9585